MKKTILALACMASLVGHAQITQISDYAAMSSNATIVPITIGDPGLAPLEHELDKAEVRLTLDLGEKYIYGRKDFAYEIAFTIKGFDVSNNVLFDNSGYVLEVDEDGPEQLMIYDFMDNPELDHVEIYDINVMTDVFDAFIQTQARADIRLMAEVVRDYRIATHQNVATNPTNYNVDIVTLGTTAGLTNRIQSFTWDNTSTGSALLFPNYQFQLLKLYNNDVNLTADPEEISANIDWNKALTIETYTGATSLKMTIAEGTGFYLFRVRPIGNYYDGGIANARNYGEWSTAPAQGTVLPVNLSNLGGSENPLFYFTDPDEDINWIYGRTFTEENKTSEQISYAGGLLNSKQSQTHIASNNKTIVTHSIQDYSGRPALTTIPVPVDPLDVGGLEGYRYDLVKNNAGDLYTADDFDKATNYENPAEIKDDGTAFSYYSNENPDLTIPDAQGYGFSRSIFYPDGTGRVMEQSGVGKVHAIGTQTGMGKTVKTYYGAPSAEELYRIFGDESPAANSVFKTITVDQNGTISITYTDKAGQVIASSLASADSDYLPSPDGENTAGMQINNSIVENVPIDRGFISTKRVAFSKSTPVTMSYNLNCEAADLGCATGGGDCGFKVQFLIQDLVRGHLYRTPEITVDCNNADMDGNLSIVPTSWTSSGSDLTFSGTTATVPAGNYIFMKRIVSYADPSDNVGPALSQIENEMIQPLVDMVIGWLYGVTNESELLAFYNQVQVFSDELAAASTPTEYTTLRDNYGFPDDFELVDGYELQWDVPFDASQWDVDFDAGTDSKPQKLFIKGGCCDRIEVPITFIPQFTCPDINDIIANSAHPGIDFEGYMMDRLAEFITANSLTKQDLIPAYADGEFNAMIYHMLAVPYACEVGGADQYQYSCEDLKKCWTAIVGAYENYDTGNNGTYNATDEMDNQDTNNDEGESTADDNADDEDNAEGSGWLMNKILERAMSGRLRGDQGEDRDIHFEFDLAREFLNCAGYKFAVILDKAEGDTPLAIDNGGSNVYPYDYNGTSRIALYPNDYSVADLQGTLRYPYIKDPIFAFKYFEYDTDESDPDLPRVKIMEHQMCYQDFTSEMQTQFAGADWCNPTECVEYHNAWDCDERFKFYSAIKNFRPTDGEANDCLPIASGAIDLDAELANLKTSCDTKCDERRAEIRYSVEQMFILNCYTIGGCATEDNDVVLSADIDAIVDEIIADCKTTCTDLGTDGNGNDDPNFPTDETKDCVNMLQDGTYCLVSGEYFYTLLSPCDEDTYQKLKYWKMKFALPTADSKCIPAKTDPAWLTEPAECPDSNDQSDSKTITVDVN